MLWYESVSLRNLSVTYFLTCSSIEHVHIDPGSNGVRRAAGVISVVAFVGFLYLEHAGRAIRSDCDSGIVVDHSVLMVPKHESRCFCRLSKSADESKRRTGT